MPALPSPSPKLNRNPPTSMSQLSAPKDVLTFGAAIVMSQYLAIWRPTSTTLHRTTRHGARALLPGDKSAMRLAIPFEIFPPPVFCLVDHQEIRGLPQDGTGIGPRTHLWRAGREIDPGMGGEGETEYRKGNDHR